MNFALGGIQKLPYKLFVPWVFVECTGRLLWIVVAHHDVVLLLNYNAFNRLHLCHEVSSQED
jgi:hypothetical protein